MQPELNNYIVVLELLVEAPDKATAIATAELKLRQGVTDVDVDIIDVYIARWDESET